MYIGVAFTFFVDLVFVLFSAHLTHLALVLTLRLAQEKQSFCTDEPGMSKEVEILNGKPCLHDGIGILTEADQKHAEATIRQTGASNLTSLKIPCR